MRYLVSVLLISILCSCNVKKGVRYFENVENRARTFDVSQTELRYQPNDLINIRISSKDNVAVAPFNLTETSFVSEDGIGATAVTTRPYLVRLDGTIEMPTLGIVSVVGKTREQLIDEIKNKLMPAYLKDPMVDIELVNFKISVLGDVSNPGVFTVENDRVTVIDAIALAGDMNLTGNRFNVMVLREEDGQKQFLRVNFLNDSLFQSPAYYLKQNDVVYVEQNAVKTREASWDSKIPVYTSIVALSLTLYAFFIR